MMRIGCGVVLAGLVFVAGCTKASTRESVETPVVATNPPSTPPPALAPPVTPPPVTPVAPTPDIAPPVTPPTPPVTTPPVTTPAAPITVALAAVTLGDDCGAQRAPVPATGGGIRKADMGMDDDGSSHKSFSKAKRACEQTSMQLSVQAPAGATPMTLQIKHVELLDESGAKLGKLTPRSPTVWSADSTYKPWDQKIAPASNLKVSYALSSPNWGAMGGRYNKTYVLEVVVTIGSKDQTVKKQVRIAAPTIMSPNVKT